MCWLTSSRCPVGSGLAVGSGDRLTMPVLWGKRGCEVLGTVWPGQARGLTLTPTVPPPCAADDEDGLGFGSEDEGRGFDDVSGGKGSKKKQGKKVRPARLKGCAWWLAGERGQGNGCGDDMRLLSAFSCVQPPLGGTAVCSGFDDDSHKAGHRCSHSPPAQQHRHRRSLSPTCLTLLPEGTGTCALSPPPVLRFCLRVLAQALCLPNLPNAPASRASSQVLTLLPEGTGTGAHSPHPPNAPACLQGSVSAGAAMYSDFFGDDGRGGWPRHRGGGAGGSLFGDSSIDFEREEAQRARRGACRVWALCGEGRGGAAGLLRGPTGAECVGVCAGV